MSTTESAAETLPNVQKPNPYTFTVVLLGKWVDIVVRDHGEERNVDSWHFPTKEEADTHAALILSALHQAVME